MKTSFLLTLILMVKKNLSQMSFLTVPHKAVYEGKLREYTPAT